MGFSVLAVDYRRFGKSAFVDGGSPTEQSANEDAEGAFTSVPDMIKETRWGLLPVGFLVTPRFDILDRIDDMTIPILFVHGTDDNIVPFAMSERLYAAAKPPKRLLRAERGSHHNLTASHFGEYQRAVSDHVGLNKRNAESGAASVGAGPGAAVKTDSATLSRKH